MWGEGGTGARLRRPGRREDEPPHTHPQPLARAGVRASPPAPRGSRRGASCPGVRGDEGLLWPWVQPLAVSPCRAGPEYQVHRGDGREPDCASPSAFQHQAGRKVKKTTKQQVAVSPKHPPFLCLTLADASAAGFVRGAAGS